MATKLDKNTILTCIVLGVLWLLALAVAFGGNAEAQSPFDKVYFAEIGDSIMAYTTAKWQQSDSIYFVFALTSDSAMVYTDSDSVVGIWYRVDIVWVRQMLYYRQLYRNANNRLTATYREATWEK